MSSSPSPSPLDPPSQSTFSTSRSSQSTTYTLLESDQGTDALSPPSDLPMGTESADDCLAVSSLGMFRVLDYTPIEGEHGIPITVYTCFRNLYRPSNNVYLRLVVGDRAIQTVIFREDALDKWRLEGSIPDPSESRTSPTVSVSVQALDSDNVVLDSVTFGQFTYWRANTSSRLKDEIELVANVPSLAEHFVFDATNTHLSPTYPVKPSHYPIRNKRGHSTRLPHSQLLRRSELAGPERDLGELNLVIVSPFESMTEGFTVKELSAGRRLVQFARTQDANNILVTCKSIEPEDYKEDQVIVSCIYRVDDGEFYVTSVDIISLLQYLVQNNFSVEEKNRIRRNLEGLHPITINKTTARLSEFFQQIMDYPAPKPRHIEKDIKVFRWSRLAPALQKVLSKYTLVQPKVPAAQPALDFVGPLFVPSHAQDQENAMDMPYPGGMSPYRYSDEFSTHDFILEQPQLAHPGVAQRSHRLGSKHVRPNPYHSAALSHGKYLRPDKRLSAGYGHI